VRTKDIDLEEDEPLIQSMGAQTVHFVQEQGKQIEKVRALQCVAVCCSVLQCVAVCCKCVVDFVQEQGKRIEQVCVLRCLQQCGAALLMFLKK